MDEKEKSQNQNMTENSGTAEKPKKKKGWLKILLIVLIVLVCIAAVISIYAVSQKDNAEEAALSHAKVSRSEVSGLYSDLELDGLTPVCEISFWTQDAKYEYEVTAFGHDVIQFEREPLSSAGQNSSAAQGDTAQGGTASGGGAGTAGTDQNGTGASGASGTSGTQSGMIGEAAAKAAVLSHAGLNESDIYGYQSWLETDHGTQIYEIEFLSGNYEYEYKVDAYSGEILSFQSDREHH